MALIEQKNRVFLWVPFCFAVGIAIYFAIKAEPTALMTLMAIFGALAFVGVKGWIDYKRGALSFVFIGCAALLIAVLGFTATQVRTSLVYTPMIVKKMSPVGVQGAIETIEPLKEGDGSRVILKEVEIERLDPEHTPRKIRLKVRKDEGLRAGQEIKVLAGLNPPSPPVAPGAFDFQRMAYFKGIGAVGFAYNAPEVVNAPKRQSYFWENLRQNLSQNIAEHTEAPKQAVLVALMTGQRQAIRDTDWKALRASGLAHMLAISGLHVGMVAGVLFFFSRLLMAAFPWFALRHPIKKYAALIALVGALLYTILVGATIPTQRALIMTGLAMVAIMLDRSPFSLRLVALAALVVLIFSPESLTSVSFQMSFAAVTALICFYEGIRPVWIAVHRQASIVRKFALYLTGVILTTVIASVATGLFSLFHFQNFALYGVLANMVAVPLVSFIVMPFAVLSYILMPFGLDGFPLAVAEWGVAWILATAHWVAGLEGAVIHASVWQHSVFIAMVCSLWFMFVWKGQGKWIALPVFGLLTVLTFFHKQPDIQISARSELVSVRDASGDLWLSTGRTDRYTASNWLRLNGQIDRDKKTWKDGANNENFPLTCDVLGCRGEINQTKLAVNFSQQANQEDCSWADVLISQRPVDDRQCDARYIVDYFDVWRHGAHALWISNNHVLIKTVDDARGDRPWAQTIIK